MRLYWFNYRTGEMDLIEDLPAESVAADYLPQTPSAQGLYRCRRALGDSVGDAMDAVYAAVTGQSAAGLRAEPGPQPKGIACVAERHRDAAVLLQFWDWAWLLLQLPYFGRRYRARVLAWLFARFPYTTGYEVWGVRLGQPWPTLNKER